MLHQVDVACVRICNHDQLFFLVLSVSNSSHYSCIVRTDTELSVN